MKIIKKQEWMSDKHWKAFFAIMNSDLIDIAIDSNDEIYAKSKRTPLTSAEIASLEILKDKCQSEYDAQEYARNRKEEYDALNQFELISDDDANGTTTHKDAIAAIKTKWPKDNSGPIE